MHTAVKGTSAFNRNIIRLAVPIVLQNLVTFAVTSADVIMLGLVSQNSLAAGSLANQVMFILNLIFAGISSGVIMLAAQYWGKQDTKTIEQIMGIGMRLSVLISTVFFITAFFFPEFLMRIFTDDIDLILSGIPYLHVISFSYLFMSFSQVYLCSMRTVERVYFATAANAVALILNVILNAIFIFGLFGAPRLGIVGVALATVIARGVELAVCIIDNLIPKVIHFRIRTVFKFNKVLFSDFLKYSLPAFGNEIVWGVAFSMYSVIMGHLGGDMVAANAVVVVARNLGSVACFGIANAGAILLGKSMGSGNNETIKADSSHFIKITIIAAILGGVVIFLFRPVFIGMADLTDAAKGYLGIMLFINMYYILGQAVNTAFICGVFRAGGDSKWGFICDTVDMWCYAVPLGFISAFVLKLPPIWVYFLICTDEFVKIPFVYRHYKSYKWLKNITRDF